MDVALTIDSADALIPPAPVEARLDLLCSTGYVVTGVSHPMPAPRAVVYARTLADGVRDRSRYFAARAISVTMTLDGRLYPPQVLVDQIAQFMHPALRPRLWLRSEGVDWRSMRVRGESLVPQVTTRYFWQLQAQFVSVSAGGSAGSSGAWEGPIETRDVTGLLPGSEPGRTYNLTFNRVYPLMTGPPGGVTILNAGTTPVSWLIRMRGPAESPVIRCPTVGCILDFSASGGLDLDDTDVVTIDARNRTVILNDDPNQSVYRFLAFPPSAWADMRPGENTWFYDPGPPGYGVAVATIAWRSAWL